MPIGSRMVLALRQAAEARRSARAQTHLSGWPPGSAAVRRRGRGGRRDPIVPGWAHPQQNLACRTARQRRLSGRTDRARARVKGIAAAGVGEGPDGRKGLSNEAPASRWRQASPVGYPAAGRVAGGVSGTCPAPGGDLNLKAEPSLYPWGPDPYIPTLCGRPRAAGQTGRWSCAGGAVWSGNRAVERGVGAAGRSA
jgi:hypothetical protein